MDYTTAAGILAAFVSTLLTAVFAQAHWSSQAKRATAGVCALVLGFLVTLASNQFGEAVPVEWGQWAAKWLVIAGGVAAVAQGIFAQFKGILSKIEDASTLTPATTDDAVADSGAIITDQTPDNEAEFVAEDTSGTPPGGDADDPLLLVGEEGPELDRP